LKYEELIAGIKNFEERWWLAEYVYFKTIEELKDVRKDLSTLTKGHMEEVVKIFLLQWGQMGRTVNREDLNWEQLTNNLRSQKESFQRLQSETLLHINFDDREITDIIKEVFRSVKVRYIGPTAISKILHLLNPELFVMWDDRIRREKYHVRANENGYLDFLKAVKQDIEEAMDDQARNSGTDKEEIIERICRELPSKKLGQKCSRKTLAKLIDEYNWMSRNL